MSSSPVVVGSFVQIPNTDKLPSKGESRPQIDPRDFGFVPMGQGGGVQTGAGPQRTGFTGPGAALPAQGKFTGPGGAEIATATAAMTGGAAAPDLGQAAFKDPYNVAEKEQKTSFPEEIEKEHGSIEKGIQWYEANLNKEPIDYRLNLQVLYNLIGQEEQAFRCAEQLLMIAPNDPRVLFNRGWHLLKREQFQHGFRLLDNGRTLSTFGNHKFFSPAPRLMDLSQLPPEVHILLHLEGGYGDELINVRFVKNLYEKTGRNIIVACQSALVPLLARMPHTAAVITHQAVTSVYHDCHVPAMSAPALLVQGYEDLYGNEPYLFTDKLPQKRKWQELIHRENPDRNVINVGIRWSGSSQFEHQQYRRFPREVVLKLLDIPHVKFFSFQKDDDLVDLPPNAFDLAPHLNDWADTACALDEMDIVISSCTSIAHCASALGKKTWVIVPVLPYYIWAFPGDESKWYKDTTLFRQSKFGQWDDVEPRLREALMKELRK